MRKNVGIASKEMKTDKATAILFLEQMIKALSISNYIFFKTEISILQTQITIIKDSEYDQYHLDMILAHVLMNAKLTYENLYGQARA